MYFHEKIQIENKMITEESPTFIIAEAGVNHNGDIRIAEKLIDAACEAGVDAVKFQAFKTESLILKSVEKAPYQKRTTDIGESQFGMLKRLELNQKQTIYLQEYCKKKKIIFLTTPFEEDSLEEVDNMEVPAIKVAATDLTNIQFLRQIAKKGKPIILSAGMCYLEEIRMALECIYPYNKDVILLQCTANYPIDNNEANLKVLQTLKKEFNILVGYSDHSVGVGAAPYAVAMGAKLIEKHFTLDKTMAGPDQRASVTTDELKKLVEEIRKVEEYLGTSVKVPTITEQKTRKALQKCMVAKMPIQKGEAFSEENITAKRTNGVGISALYYDYIVNQKAKRNYEIDDIIE